MKHDKKTNRVLQVNRREAAENMNDDQDDIVRNMTNLILHKKEEKPWEKSLLDMDTAPNTTVMRANQFGGGKKKPLLLSNKMNDAESKLNMFLNPVVESFLSFSLENNQTGLFTNMNVTAINQNPNLLEQTAFDDNNQQHFLDHTFGGAEPQPYEQSAPPSSLPASKLRPNPFGETHIQKRSQATLRQFNSQPSATFTQISKTVVHEDERDLQPRD